MAPATLNYVSAEVQKCVSPTAIGNLALDVPISSGERGGLGPGPAVPEIWTLLVTCYKERMDGPLARRQ